jgi:hypothetical protein
MSGLKWEVSDDYQRVVVIDAPSRRDALGEAFSPHLGMSKEVYEILQKKDRLTAGWATIAEAGWVIRPMKTPALNWGAVRENPI